MVEQVVVVSKDTYASGLHPDSPGGDYDSVYLVRNRDSYLGFDISSAPAVGISSVYLHIFQVNFGQDSAEDAYFERTIEDWEEATLTYNNAPDTTEDNRYKHSIPAKANAWRSFDVTNLYLDAISGGELGIKIVDADPLEGLTYYRFYSKEKSSAYASYLLIEYAEVPALAFSDVAVSRRYGGRLYLSGSIENIAESDEICVYYKRPGDDGIRNLKSDTSGYLYFKGASGSYDLGANNRYIEFERAGLHWLKIWDVAGNCEMPILERASWLMDIKLPRYQYQVIFDLVDPDLGDNLWRLEAEYAKYAAAGSWFVNHDEPDCFDCIQAINSPEDDTRQSGWLSLGVEFGASPCAPLPYYLCPLPTPQTQYWRGECSCDLFKDTLQPLGIPCSHLIAAMNWYSGEPAWSDYVKCP
jgi:hypothetical protein